MIRQKEIPTAELVYGNSVGEHVDTSGCGIRRLAVTSRYSNQEERGNGSTYHGNECVHEVTLEEVSEEIHHGESPGRLLKFRLRCKNWVRVLRPQCSAFDKHFDDSLSTADRLASLSSMLAGGKKLCAPE